MGFGIVAIAYISALLLTIALIFLVIYHVNPFFMYLSSFFRL